MTSSLSDLEIKGVQTPRLRVECKQAGNDAAEAAALASGYGLTPDPWQLYVLEQWLAYGENGKWAHGRCGLSVPRQNGKNALIEIRELYGMIGRGEHILHTAHEVKTARKAFKRLQHFFGEKKDDPSAKFPELNALVKELRSTNGQEAIILKNGGSVEFVARSKGSARGFTIDIVIMDEAQQMDDDALDALGPTTRAAPLKNRQFIWTGTPPKPDENGEVFTRIRMQALEGKATRACWHEWSMNEDADLDSPIEWALSNPALGYRLDIDVVVEDRETYSDEGFARECGGCWKFAGTGAVIDADSWRAVGDGASRREGAVAFAVDISPDRSTASISVAGARADGLYHVEVIHNRQGTGWLIPELKRLVAQHGPVSVVVDGPASSLVPELSGSVPVVVTTPGQFGVACGLFFDSVMNGAMRHPNQPLFTDAIEVARKRPLGDSWAWGRKNSASDITPVVSATLALYGFVNARPVKRKRSGGGRVLVMS